MEARSKLKLIPDDASYVQVYLMRENCIMYACLYVCMYVYVTPHTNMQGQPAHQKNNATVLKAKANAR